MRYLVACALPLLFTACAGLAVARDSSLVGVAAGAGAFIGPVGATVAAILAVLGIKASEGDTLQNGIQGFPFDPAGHTRVLLTIGAVVLVLVLANFVASKVMPYKAEPPKPKKKKPKKTCKMTN